jgi:chemotaxis signal transduction protein
MQYSLQDKLKQLKDSFDLSVSKPIENQKRDGAKFLTFDIHNESFAWPLKNLKEILINQKIIPIPARQTMLCGIINYKNQVQSVLNLSMLLGLPKTKIGTDIKTKQGKEYNTVLVTRSLAQDMSIIVDRLGLILFIAWDEIKPKPVAIKSELSDLIDGQIYRKKQLITILNPNAIKSLKTDE